nr:unnamed protein product [Callosobruchus chinensis]
MLCPLSTLINVSLSFNAFPSGLKISKVVPIFKQGSVADILNYRPISIVLYFAKTFQILL